MSSWVNGDVFGDTDRITTIQDVITLMDMPAENITHFKREILKYCKENFVKVEAFIPSPFVSKYLLDEV